MPDLTRTADGARIGTPLYFAPEQFRGTKYDIDHRTDLFAFGLLLYEAATGSSAFFVEGMTLQSLEAAVCKSQSAFERDRFQGLPKKLQLLIRKLLSKDRSERPREAGQVAIIIGKIGAEL